MDRTTHEYPLSRFDVEQRNPDISGAQVWDDAILIALNIYDVLPRESQLTPQYNQKVVETTPIEINGQWFQDWVLQPLSAEEYDQAKELEWQKVIATQNEILNSNIVIDNNGQIQLPPVIVYDYTLPAGNFNVFVQDGTVTINDIQFNKVNFIINNTAYVPNPNQVLVTDNLIVTSDNPIYYFEDVDLTDSTQNEITYFGNGVVMVTGTTTLPIDDSTHTVWTKFGKIPVKGPGVAIVNDYGIFPLVNRPTETPVASTSDIDLPLPENIIPFEISTTGNVIVSINDSVEIVDPYPKEQIYQESQSIPQEVYQAYISTVSNITITYTNPFEVVWPPNPLLENLNPPGPNLV